jgi:hypothetical protein
VTRAILLDTNILIWALNEDRFLTSRMRSAITPPGADVRLSVVSACCRRTSRNCWPFRRITETLLTGCSLRKRAEGWLSPQCSYFFEGRVRRGLCLRARAGSSGEPFAGR